MNHVAIELMDGNGARETRSEVLSTKVSIREKRVIRDAAKNHGMTITNFLLTDPRLGETSRDAHVIITRPELVAPGLRLGDWSQVNP